MLGGGEWSDVLKFEIIIVKLDDGPKYTTHNNFTSFFSVRNLLCWHLVRTVLSTPDCFNVTNGLFLAIHCVTFENVIFICFDCFYSIIYNSEKSIKKTNIIINQFKSGNVI